jgi:hypothetical protein
MYYINQRKDAGAFMNQKSSCSDLYDGIRWLLTECPMDNINIGDYSVEIEWITLPKENVVWFTFRKMPTSRPYPNGFPIRYTYVDGEDFDLLAEKVARDFFCMRLEGKI